MRRVRRLYSFRIEAWVVLPDHLHCVWTLPPGDGDFAVRWRLIKLLFCKELPHEERLSAMRRRRKERGIWQRRYWEHTLRDEKDFQAHVDYVHINPVTHGLVERAADWPYSTFHRHVKAGILSTNWAGGDEESIAASGERVYEIMKTCGGLRLRRETALRILSGFHSSPARAIKNKSPPHPCSAPLRGRPSAVQIRSRRNYRTR